MTTSKRLGGASGEVAVGGRAATNAATTNNAASLIFARPQMRLTQAAPVSPLNERFRL